MLSMSPGLLDRLGDMLLVILFRVIDMLIGAYITVLFARMILDWVTVLSPRWYPTGVIASLISVVYHRTPVALAAPLHTADPVGPHLARRQFSGAVFRASCAADSDLMIDKIVNKPPTDEH